MDVTKDEAKGNFSVALGLLDYVNPVFYLVTVVTLVLNLKGVLELPMLIVYLMGALVSIIFGFTIPTVKVLVGLGKMKFQLPVNLVTYVNIGILTSGIVLLCHMLKLKFIVCFAIVLVSILALLIAYKKIEKFNSIAVLIGAIGYLFIYISLITFALRAGVTISIVFYAIAICLYLALVCIGVFGDVMNAKVHWVIESCNICCQGSVAIATVLMFILSK